MRQRIIYYLKHSIVLQSVILHLGSMFLKLMALFVRTQPDLILFCDNSGKVFEGDSGKVLFDAMKCHPFFSSFRCVWAFDSPENWEVNGADKVRIDSLSYFIAALKAKIWITNTNIERGMRFKKKDQIYLNTWHGTGPKAFGNVGKRRYYHFEDIDILCCDGEYQRNAMVNLFGAKDSSIIYSGRPREDELYSLTGSKIGAYRKQLSIPDKKRVILYAPTWRDSKDSGKTYQFTPPISIPKWKQCLGEDYIVLFRSHHVSTSSDNLVFSDFFRDVSTYPSINHLYAVADILITDYSSTMFDYAILNKPIVCFAFDFDEFRQETNLLFDMEKKMPSGVIREEDQLLKHIQEMDYQNEQNKTNEFREMFISRGENATQVCINALEIALTRKTD